MRSTETCSRRLALGLAVALACSATGASDGEPEAGGSTPEQKERAELVQQIVQLVDPLALQRKWVDFQTSGMEGWYAQTLAEFMLKDGSQEEFGERLTPELILASRERYVEHMRQGLESLDYPAIYADVFGRSFNSRFSVAELRDLAKFFGTATGTHLIREFNELDIDLLDTQVVVGDKTSEFMNAGFEAQIAWLRGQLADR